MEKNGFQDETEKILEKLKFLADKSVKKNKKETALSAMTAYASLSYWYNQIYVDSELESWVERIENTIEKPSFSKKECKDNILLFYDGFGLDTRGLALIYLKALIKIGLKVVYVVPETARNNQVEVLSVLSKGMYVIEYIKIAQSNIKRIEQICKIFDKYRPARAMFYTTPHDIAGEVAFAHYAGIVSRFQINLTDHAFWAGQKAFDYCIEFREYGARVSAQYRKIAPEKIRLLPYYPYVNRDTPFEGLPFEYKGKKILFSGGALYKTIDKDMTYYKIVNAVLQRNEDIIFLYAGIGDEKGINWLKKNHAGRVYHIAERKDLFEIMRHIYLYLNTYPMIGGLMTQYSAIAGKLPMTFIKPESDDAKGILLNENELGIYYENEDEFLLEIDRLINDKCYYEHKSSLLKYSIITEDEFAEALKVILDGMPTKYSYELSPINTEKFREDYAYRMGRSVCENAVVRRTTVALFPFFPGYFFSRGIRKAKSICGRWRGKGKV